MKKRLKTLPYLAMLFVLCGFGPSGKYRGIDFFKGSWQQALDKAKSDDKYIFLDIYATWCGPCKQLKNKTFKDAEAGEYFNANFINVRIDGETEEGIELVRQYGVTSYPTLFIIDKNGRRMAKTTGFMKPHILVNFGRRVVP